MKAAFPGEMTTVALVSPKHLRHHRLNIRPMRPLTNTEANDRDWHEIEDIEKGGPIAIADHFIINDGDEQTLHTNIDVVLQRIDF